MPGEQGIEKPGIAGRAMTGEAGRPVSPVFWKLGGRPDVPLIVDAFLQEFVVIRRIERSSLTVELVQTQTHQSCRFAD